MNTWACRLAFVPSPCHKWQIDLPLRKAQYIRTSVCSTVVEGDCVCIMGAWDMRDRAVPTAKGAGRPRTGSLA